MPNSIIGVTGERNVAELWKNKLNGIFISVQILRDLNISELHRNASLSAVE